MIVTEPPDVVDRLLWRDAQHIIGRHNGPDPEDRCAWCGREWPCPPRRLAERAEEAARRPWQEAWTARHDLNGLRTLPGWRADLGDRAHLGDYADAGTGGGRGPRVANRGLFR